MITAYAICEALFSSPDLPDPSRCPTAGWRHQSPCKQPKLTLNNREDGFGLPLIQAVLLQWLRRTTAIITQAPVSDQLKTVGYTSVLFELQKQVFL